MGAPRVRPAGDEGASLVELLVVTVLLIVAGGIVTTGVVSAHGVTRTADERVTAVTSIHQTVARVSREIRAADSRDTVNRALRSASPQGLETDVLRGDPQQRIRYTYGVADGALVERRRVWTVSPSPAELSDTTQTLITDLANAGDQPVFSYRRSDGSCISGCADPSGSYVGTAVGDADLAEVAEVRINVRRAVGDGPPIEVVTRVVLRNG